MPRCTPRARAAWPTIPGWSCRTRRVRGCPRAARATGPRSCAPTTRRPCTRRLRRRRRWRPGCSIGWSWSGVEALGANRLAGVGRNLDRLRAAEPARAAGAAGELAALARAAFRTAPNGDSPLHAAARPALDAGTSDRAATGLRALRDALPDQRAFGRAARALAVEIAARLDPAEAPPEGARHDDGGPADGEPDEPDAARDEGDGDPDDDAGAEEVADVPEGRGRRRGARSLTNRSRPPARPRTGRLSPPRRSTRRRCRGRDPVLVEADSGRRPYRAWTTAHDEVLRPHQLADAASLAHWRAELDRHIALQGRIVRRLAAKLARALLAAQRREWQFDQDEGELERRAPGPARHPAPVAAGVPKRDRGAVPRHERDAADRQLALDARPAHHHRRGRRRHPRDDARALRGLGRGAGLHDRGAPRRALHGGLGGGRTGPADPGRAERSAAHRLQQGRRHALPHRAGARSG